MPLADLQPFIDFIGDLFRSFAEVAPQSGFVMTAARAINERSVSFRTVTSWALFHDDFLSGIQLPIPPFSLGDELLRRVDDREDLGAEGQRPPLITVLRYSMAVP